MKSKTNPFFKSILPELLKLHPGLPRTRQHEYLWAIERITKPHSEILDVGCDGSILDKYLIDLGHGCTCADIDPEGAYYVDGEPRDNFVQVDCRYPLEEWHHRFDYITIISTLEHLEGDDDIKMVENLESCLRRGGKFLITVPYGEGLKMQGQWEVRCYDEHNVSRIADPARLKVVSWRMVPTSLTKANLPLFFVELERG